MERERKNRSANLEEEEKKDGNPLLANRLLLLTEFRNRNRTFHPRIYQSKLENEHDPEAREQADHEDVVMKRGGASRESPARRVGRRDDDAPQNSKHNEEESVRCRRENGDGRHHVRACAPCPAVEAEAGLGGKARKIGREREGDKVG